MAIYSMVSSEKVEMVTYSPVSRTLIIHFTEGEVYTKRVDKGTTIDLLQVKYNASSMKLKKGDFLVSRHLEI